LILRTLMKKRGALRAAADMLISGRRLGSVRSYKFSFLPSRLPRASIPGVRNFEQHAFVPRHRFGEAPALLGVALECGDFVLILHSTPFASLTLVN
jgi:hypothetical protein